MKYGDISLVLCISTRLRLVTILSLLVKYLVIFHADPCNKSYIYIYTDTNPITLLCSLARAGKKCHGVKQNAKKCAIGETECNEILSLFFFILGRQRIYQKRKKGWERRERIEKERREKRQKGAELTI